MKTKTIKCEFKNSRGHLLDARLDVRNDFEDNSAQTFIVFCHCFTCTKETITTYRISRLLAESGFAVLRFDFTGLGNSEGNFSSTTFKSTQDDLRSAITFLKNNYQAPSFLMGHSLGGTTALSVCAEQETVIGAVAIASPSEPAHVLHHFGQALTLLEQNIPTSFEVAGQFYDIEPEFVTDVKATDMPKTLSQLNKPVLLFNIEKDALVDETNAKQIAQWTSGESRIINVAGTDHLLSNRVASENVAQTIIDWIGNDV